MAARKLNESLSLFIMRGSDLGSRGLPIPANINPNTEFIYIYTQVPAKNRFR